MRPARHSNPTKNDKYPIKNMKQILPNNRFCRVSAALVLALATLSCSSDE